MPDIITVASRTANIIRNKYYDLARPEDYAYSIVCYMAGQVTKDELASFINDGIEYKNQLDLWTALIGHNFGNLYIPEAVADVFSSSKISGKNIKKILENKFVSGDRVQSILYAMIDKGYFDKVLEIITSEASDETISADTTNTEGVMLRKTLTIESGVTLTIGKAPGVIIADTITNNGNIVSGWIKATGGEKYTKGGDGTGGLIILARNITIGTISVNGKNGQNGYETAETVDGLNGNGGEFWIITGDTVPNGGNGGARYDRYRGWGNPNAGGGGAVDGVAVKGGDGGSATITEFSDGLTLLKEIFKGIVDWWIQNILGKSPSSTKSIPELGGSGGGGGAAGNPHCGGGGGGGAGELILYGTVINAGTVEAKGGNGGNGYENGCGGGGGGGGIIYVFYGTINGTMNYDVSGGAGGTGALNGEDGGTGVYREIAI